MFNLRTPLFLASVLAGLSVLIALPAAAQHSGHTMPMPAPATSPATLPLAVQSATIVAVPPSIKDTSAFITVKNTSTKSIKLTGVSASFAGHAMFMKTVKTQKMTGMLPTPGFVVPAGGTLTMQNDGDHVMLMALTRPLKEGEVLPIVLQASDGRTFTARATVKKP